MTTPNAELAYKVLDHIDAHPEEWNQRRWVCGSAGCFGGWALRIGADAAVTYGPDGVVVVSGPEELVGMSAEIAADLVLRLRSAWRDDGDDELEWLYDPELSREGLGRTVEAFFGPRPEPTP